MAQRDWVVEHMARYRETDGADGHIWTGRDGKQELPCLLLTTTGRRSDTRHETALIYGQDGDDHVIVASIGGAPKHPLWYENLVVNPRVEIQVLADCFAAKARTATGAERERLWQMMARIFPTYEQYKEKAKSSREIPVVVLERAR